MSYGNRTLVYFKNNKIKMRFLLKVYPIGKWADCAFWSVLYIRCEFVVILKMCNMHFLMKNFFWLSNMFGRAYFVLLQNSWVAKSPLGKKGKVSIRPCHKLLNLMDKLNIISSNLYIDINSFERFVLPPGIVFRQSRWNLYCWFCLVFLYVISRLCHKGYNYINK